MMKKIFFAMNSDTFSPYKNMRKILSISVCFLIVLYVSVYCSEREKNIAEMKKIAVEAVCERSPFARLNKDYLSVKLLENPCFKKSKIFEVNISAGFSAKLRSFVVVADRNSDTYVFKSEKDCDNFSKVIKKEKIIITNSNINEYISCVILLLGSYPYTKLISNIDELTFLPHEAKKDFEKYRAVVAPPEYNIRKKRITFCTMNIRGFIKKWELLVAENGEISLCDVKKIVQISDYKGFYIWQQIEQNKKEDLCKPPDHPPPDSPE